MYAEDVGQIFAPKMEDLTGDWRRVPIEELCD